MTAPLPDNEQRRLLALRRFHIMDTLREQSFDDLAQLAKLICNTSIALITLIDEDRQWFKSCLGMEGTGTTRDLAFCAHAILQPNQLLVIEDTLRDSRFADHPAVTGEPYIRFYAGAPLVSDSGDALGTICVVDTETRQLTQLQADAMKLLSRQVMQLLELRVTNQLARQYADNFRSLSDSVPVLIAQLDQDQRYIFGNRKYQEWFGVAPGDLLGKTQKEAFGDSYADRTYELLQGCYQGKLAHFEVDVPNGQTLSVDYVPQHNSSANIKGNVAGVFIIATDITEQKQQQQALEFERKKLQENEERLQAMISNFPGAVYRCENNARWTMLYLSAAVQQLTGHPVSAYLNDSLSLTDITHLDDVPMVYETVQHALIHSEPFHLIYRLQHADGHWCWVEEAGCGVYDATGELKYIDGFIWDITERKHIEQMKNEFVSSVSHELRTPLTSISGSLSLITSGMLGDLPAPISNMLGIAYKNAQRLTLLINDLLDMEKIVAGKMVFDMSVQPLLPIIEQSLETNKAYADTYGVRLVLNATSPAVHAHIDTLRLQQVLANFISNAVKFSPTGGAVEIQMNLRDQQVEIAVIDHGPGVSDEFRARIFQKFAQADASDSRQRGGTGLGLAISKAFVERMHGSIGFESELGRGATFFARFPVVEPSA